MTTFTNNKKGQLKLHNIDAVKTNQLQLHKYSNCGSIGQAFSRLINADSHNHLNHTNKNITFPFFITNIVRFCI